ncbi:MlaD family protein [Nocardia puris]|uniref:Virulence factor Mce-like protein n=1 Tax=Nocardia puris TaxID=208602 RepID=A0A366E2R9_9NOCA|nr:MlaD family protein [Nocardia puris]MBF6209647.1 MCE family protein [Nocardia puris]RBO96089.1 virulence factor Mce-like protein [Nocardia puris]
MHGFVGSKGFVTLVGAVVAAVAAVVGYVVVTGPVQPMRSYCATMPDAIGLYPGSHVTLRGLVVGTVTGVAHEGAGVRVDFTVDAERPLRGEVGATTVADTLTADRRLAVLSDSPGGTEWDSDRCIARTLTPLSISRTMQAASDLVGELGGTPGGPNVVGDALAAVHAAAAGTGPEFERLITQLGELADAPETSVATVGSLIDALSSLSASVSANWEELTSVLTRFPGVFDQINNEIFARLSGLIDSLAVLLPMANEITTLYGDAILGGLGATVPALRLVAGHAESLRASTELVPALIQAFDRVTDPATGEVVLTYRSPTVALPASAPDALCGGGVVHGPVCAPGAPVTLADLLTMLVSAR